MGLKLACYPSSRSSVEDFGGMSLQEIVGPAKTSVWKTPMT
jgi:hypothetical protein